MIFVSHPGGTSPAMAEFAYARWRSSVCGRLFLTILTSGYDTCAPERPSLNASQQTVNSIERTLNALGFKALSR